MADTAQDYSNMLDDDALAPLKRNHACLQCKKRKVKCDAVSLLILVGMCVTSPLLPFASDIFSSSLLVRLACAHTPMPYERLNAHPVPYLHYAVRMQNQIVPKGHLRPTISPSTLRSRYRAILSKLDQNIIVGRWGPLRRPKRRKEESRNPFPGEVPVRWSKRGKRD
jgi:hypothetical protein